jgi:hypothetical protein
MTWCSQSQLLASSKQARKHGSRSAGSDNDGASRNCAYTFFQVDFTLTSEGLDTGPGFGLAPVGLLFEYIAMLKRHGPQQWVWEETRKLSDMRFRCSSTLATCASGDAPLRPLHAAWCCNGTCVRCLLRPCGEAHEMHVDMACGACPSCV